MHWLTRWLDCYRLKALEEEPYSIEESERAAGMGSYIQPKRRRVMGHDELLEEIGEKRIDDQQEPDSDKKATELTSSPTSQ